MLFINLQLFGEEDAGMADSGFAAGEADIGMADDQQAAPATERPTFDDLINGDYKRDYQAKIQEAIGKRFKNQQDNQKIIDSMNPVLTLLAQRYGVQPDKDGNLDYQALQQQISDDNSIYEREAFDRGMSVEDLKHMKQLEMQNEQLTRQRDASLQEEASRRAFNELVNQGEQLKQLYPNFDLNAEMQNPEFGRLIAVNIPVRTAYELIHKDEIMGSMTGYAVQHTKEAISKSIQSGMRRPSENGTRSQASASTGVVDPSKFTRADFQRIKQEAERGKRITFD